MSTYEIFVDNDKALGFSYYNSLNSLPTLNVKIKDYMLLSNYNTFNLGFRLRDNYNNLLFIRVTPNLEWDIINQRFDGEVLNLTCVYPNFLNFPPTIIGNQNLFYTRCNRTIESAFADYLALYGNCFNSKNLDWDLENQYGKFSNNILLRFNPDGSLIDFLNLLQKFGFIWYIILWSQTESSLRILHLLDVIYELDNDWYWYTIDKYSKVEIEQENLMARKMLLVKEPYQTIERIITLTADNPCFVVPDENLYIASVTILERNYLYLDVVGFTYEGDKIYARNVLGGVNPNCAGIVRVDIPSCAGGYEFTLIKGQGYYDCNGNSRNLCQGWVEERKNPDGTTSHFCNENLEIMFTGYCSSTSSRIGQLRMVRTDDGAGRWFMYPNDAYIKLKLEYCLVNNSQFDDCILLPDNLADFDASMYTHTIQNNLDACLTEYREERFSNIDSNLWDLIKAYYEFMMSRSKTRIILENVYNRWVNVGDNVRVKVNDNYFKGIVESVELNVDGDKVSNRVTILTWL